VLSAYVDESIRHRSGEATSVYALAAVIVDDRGVAELTRTMENLRYRKNVRVAAGAAGAPSSDHRGARCFGTEQCRDRVPAQN
jgi:hypothetical protein